MGSTRMTRFTQAPVGTSATTSYQSPRPNTLQAAAKVFINSGSGGAGTWGIPLAKVLVVEVVAMCSTAEHRAENFASSLILTRWLTTCIRGQISWRASRPEILQPSFDLVIDNACSTMELCDHSMQYLRPGGTFVFVGPSAHKSLCGTYSIILAMQMCPVFIGRGQGRLYFVQQKSDQSFFEQTGRWMREGNAISIIDSTLSFDEMPEAFKKLREGRVKG
jgi:NADPH:quinone reductase-like Zn-dependent oxidoreductase